MTTTESNTLLANVPDWINSFPRASFTHSCLSKMNLLQLRGEKRKPRMEPKPWLRAHICGQRIKIHFYFSSIFLFKFLKSNFFSLDTRIAAEFFSAVCSTSRNLINRLQNLRKSALFSIPHNTFHSPLSPPCCFLNQTLLKRGQ